MSLLVWSPLLIVDGIELHLAITSGELRKETAKYAELRAPLDAILLPGDLHSEALLQHRFLAPETASIDGDMVIAGEMQRTIERTRDDGKG